MSKKPEPKEMMDLTYLSEETRYKLGMIEERCYIAFRNKKANWIGIAPGDAYICKTLAMHFAAMAEYYEKEAASTGSH